MACDTEGGKGNERWRNLSCGETGGWQLLFDMCWETGTAGTSLKCTEEGERAREREKGRYARWHPRTFSNTFSCQREWASVVKGATGHTPCPLQHRSHNPSQALLEVHRSVRVCVRNTPYGSVHLQVIITTARITCMIKRSSTPALGHDLNVTPVLPTEFRFFFFSNYKHILKPTII